MELPYFDDASEALARLTPLGDACVLDSAGSDSGRWDIIAAAPVFVSGIFIAGQL